MPDFYPPGEYDLAGFIVGIVDREKLIDGTAIQPGDVLLGLPPQGCIPMDTHLRGALFFGGWDCARTTWFRNRELRWPICCWPRTEAIWRVVEPLLDHGLIKGMAHITGGGMTENLPRILPAGTSAADPPKFLAGPPRISTICRQGGH